MVSYTHQKASAKYDTFWQYLSACHGNFMQVRNPKTSDRAVTWTHNKWMESEVIYSLWVYIVSH
jgi:hypothetical protein